MKTVTFKLPASLADELDALARARRTTRSEVVREAIEAYASASAARPSVTDAAGDLVGSVAGPRDLASNPGRLAAYGE